ncbi:serine/threonine-protein kinase [Actinophytocola sp.]|uniref:serine/threonine-protein kinase n=1 Tax=Actinophytocola sp. TaxID=1872138 RepID=UPI0038999DF6
MIEQIGSGAMGVVWKAQDERLGRIVAIKRLVVRYGLSSTMTEEVRRRAMREARIAARLQHRNAIALFDVAEDEGDPILVMEFLPSKSLSAVLEERGTLPPNEAAEIGAQVAEALAAAHAVGVAHRDIKPGNILLAENGTVKITDFGISRALDDGTVTTQTGMLAGTPAYLAPEIARGDDPSRASDVFSLGSTLYHAIEGWPPFGTNTNPLALLHAVASGNVPRPRNAGPLEPTLMSLMKVDPSERPTMKEVAEALATAATQILPVPATASTSAPKTPPRPTLVVPQTPQTPPTPPQPMEALPSAAYRRPEQPMGKAGPSRRNLVIIGVVAAVVLVGTLFTVLILNGGDGGGNPGNTAQGDTTTSKQAGQQQNGGGNSTEEKPPPSTGKSTTTTPSSPSSSPNATQITPPPGQDIPFSPAGQFVINYYNSSSSLDQRWAMLSPYAQAQFGGRAGFDQWWSQYTSVSSSDSNDVRKNPDGSLDVPATVTYTSATGSSSERRRVRVTVLNGNLLIDSLAK